jgi:hypothetical protein
MTQERIVCHGTMIDGSTARPCRSALPFRTNFAPSSEGYKILVTRAEQAAGWKSDESGDWCPVHKSVRVNRVRMAV